MNEELASYQASVTLVDGTPVTIRAVRPSDKPLLEAAFEHLGPQSRYFRFFAPKPALSVGELRYFTELDFTRHVALAAMLEPQAENNLIGVGRYILLDALDPRSAEVAFAVEDEFHGMGVATLLLEHLVKIAAQQRIVVFKAHVMSENRKMLEVFEHSGLSPRFLTSSGETQVTLSLPTNARAEARQVGSRWPI